MVNGNVYGTQQGWEDAKRRVKQQQVRDYLRTLHEDVRREVEASCVQLFQDNDIIMEA